MQGPLPALLFLFTACASVVTTARIDIPQGVALYEVQGANARRWNQPLSIGS